MFYRNCWKCLCDHAYEPSEGIRAAHTVWCQRVIPRRLACPCCQQISLLPLRNSHSARVKFSSPQFLKITQTPLLFLFIQRQLKWINGLSGFATRNHILLSSSKMLYLFYFALLETQKRGWKCLLLYLWILISVISVIYCFDKPPQHLVA